MEFAVKYTIDIVLIIIVVTSILDSARRGFIRCVLSLVCAAVALAAAVQFSQPFAEAVYDNFLSDIVVEQVEQRIPDGINSNIAVDTVTQTIEMLPEYLIEQVKGLGVDIRAFSDYISSLELSAQDTAREISEKIVRPGALVLLKLVCYILIFIAVRFVLGFAVGLIDKFASLPILGHVNKWLGGALGCMKGVVFVLVLSTLLNAFGSLVRSNAEFENFAMAIKSSRICSAVSELGLADLTEIDLDNLDFTD